MELALDADYNCKNRYKGVVDLHTELSTADATALRYIVISPNDSLGETITPRR
jgi:hypothetical protein